MNRLKKGTALLLALVLTLALAACGSRDDDRTEQLTGTVYVPEFLDFKLDVDYIQTGCASNDAVYILGSKGQEREETDPETGEVMYYYDETYSLYRIPLDGGEAGKLENYQPTAIPEGTEGNVSVQSISAGDDGTLWVTENVNSYTFDLPEDFNPETDDRWNYQNFESSVIRRQLDGTGNELSRVDVSNLEEKLGLDYVNIQLFDPAGNIFVSTDTEIIMLDAQLNKLFSVEGTDLWGQLILLGDGSVGMLSYDYSEEKESGSWKMKTVDPEAKDWGAEYALPANAYNAYPGGGEFLFYYQNGDSIYGYKAGAEEGEKIFSWIDSDINRNNMAFFSFLPDGRVVVVTREWGENESKVELAIMTATDRSTLPERTTLTYATMYLGYDTRNQIIDFNKTSDKYRIEVRDYSEFNTEEDASAGLTRLNTEIVAGNVPDMLETSSIPLRQYAGKGLLEDLWPYIENDADIGGRAGVMEHVLNASEQGGKLYEIFGGFTIRSVAGPKNIVGDRMSWTLADMQEALAKMPEGCAIFGQYDTKGDMLRTVMAQNADSFVDWSTGQCYFDSENFKALLTFCNSFPAEFNWEEMDEDEWEDEYTRIMGGKQMLTTVYFSDLRWDFMQNDGLFMNQGGASFVGYPREDGGVGSSFSTDSGIAMSSACKDKEGAWSFMRTRLLPQSTGEDGSEDNVVYYRGGFPVNKADFDRMIQDAMTTRYELDEDGNQVLDENGQPIEVKESWWISDDVQMEQGAVTQEQYDRFMALYNAVDSVYYYDEAIYDIVSEMAGAYFAGDRSLDDTAAQIQSRVTLYVNENR